MGSRLPARRAAPVADPQELTALDIRTDGSRILTLDDPELFKYPIAFMWEPGFWNLTDREAESFRAYLLKGGFAVFEDFDGPQQWTNFEAQMRRVLPDGRFVKLDNTHRIFNSFFQIQDIDAIVHPMSGIRPSYYGIFEDNDPSKRLMVVANFDNDVPEYWEWSGQGLFPFDASNEAYKLGVNYVIYGLTHEVRGRALAAGEVRMKQRDRFVTALVVVCALTTVLGFSWPVSAQSNDWTEPFPPY